MMNLQPVEQETADAMTQMVITKETVVVEPTAQSLPAPETESFWQALVRWARYAIGTFVSCVVLFYVVWPLLAPAPWSGSASLVAHGWGLALINTLVVALVVVVLLVICMWLTHPDFPHAGLLCVSLAFCVLAMKAGPMHTLLRVYQGRYSILYHLLVGECVLWAMIIAVAELTSRMLFQRFFHNPRWASRAGLALPADLNQPHLLYSAPDILFRLRDRPLGQNPTDRLAANAAAFAITVVIGGLVANFFMRSELIGQVLFSCFVAFAIAAFFAAMFTPAATALWIWLAVPATAIVGYMLTGNQDVYPGHVPFPLARAMPLDYVSAGLAGAIIGYYTAVKLELHQRADEQYPAA